jgi:hypothetical protein
VLKQAAAALSHAAAAAKQYSAVLKQVTAVLSHAAAAAK